MVSLVFLGPMICVGILEKVMTGSDLVISVGKIVFTRAMVVACAVVLGGLSCHFSCLGSFLQRVVFRMSLIPSLVLPYQEVAFNDPFGIGVDKMVPDGEAVVFALHWLMYLL